MYYKMSPTFLRRLFDFAFNLGYKFAVAKKKGDIEELDTEFKKWVRINLEGRDE